MIYMLENMVGNLKFIFWISYHFSSLLFHGEFVVVHAVHVALDEGFHLAFHLAERVLWHGAEHIVLESRVCAIVIGMGDAVPIEFDGVVAFHKFIPIDFGYPMHGKGFVGRRVEHVLSESEVRDVVTQVVEHRWHDVGLLHYTFRVVTAERGIAW